MKDDIHFLKDLQNELKTQDNDCQAAPRFWSIMDYKWVVTAEDYHDRTSIFFVNDCETIELQQYVDDILECEIDHDLEAGELEELEELVEYHSDTDIFEWINEKIDADCYLVYEKEEAFIAPNTMFLTKEEAKEHLRKNHYHYSPRAHIYAMTAWRAPKVERLLKILETFDWDKVYA